MRRSLFFVAKLCLSFSAPLCVLASLVRASSSSIYTYSHLAGSLDGPGHRDGHGTDARFNRLSYIIRDSHGNVFVADDGQVIRKITAAGEVTTLVGHITSSAATDGTSTHATFSSIQGFALDSSDNLYVIDSGKGIRKVAADGAVTTIAPVPPFYGSPLQAGSSRGIVRDSSGNFFVADSVQCVVWKFSNGSYTTFAGSINVPGSADGVGSAAQFKNLRAITSDQNGNLYVCDSGDSIRKIDANGVVTTLAGTVGVDGYVDAAGTAARLSSIAAITTDLQRNLYVSE